MTMPDDEPDRRMHGHGDWRTHGDGLLWWFEPQEELRLETLGDRAPKDDWSWFQDPADWPDREDS